MYSGNTLQVQPLSATQVTDHQSLGTGRATACFLIVSQIWGAKVGKTIGPFGKKTVVPGEGVGRGSEELTPCIWNTKEGQLQCPPLPQ